MNKQQTKIRVRYSETDKMGVVYHGNYIQYFEVGRVEYLRDLGFVYAELEKKGVLLPVVNVNINFKNPAVYDEELTIETWVEALPTSKIIFHNKVTGDNGKAVCEAQVTLVFVNDKFRPMKAPDFIVDVLKENGVS